MTGKILLSIISGASLGALTRYGFALKFNSFFPTIPFGTVLANLLGAFLMGIIVSAAGGKSLPKELVIGITSGFLASLTTFSTFSAELFDLLTKREYFYTVILASVHLFGSLLFFALGHLLVKWCFSLVGER